MEQISISLDIIKDFLTYFCKICFNFEAIYWLLFIPSMIICLYTAKKRNEIKKFVFPILYVFALLTTLFSLILCGKTNVDMSIPAFELGGYWITHNNIIFLYKMLLLIPLFICLSYIFRKSQIKTILISSFIFILILTSTIKEETFQYIIYKANNNIRAKQGNYIIEKIMRFFYLNNEEIQLQKLYKNAKTLHYAEDPNLYINTYIRRIYKDMDTKKITYTLTDNAVKEFIQKGGSISKTELENIKFQNLYTTNIQDLKKISNDNLSEEEIIDLLEN